MDEVMVLGIAFGTFVAIFSPLLYKKIVTAVNGKITTIREDFLSLQEEKEKLEHEVKEHKNTLSSMKKEMEITIAETQKRCEEMLAKEKQEIDALLEQRSAHTLDAVSNSASLLFARAREEAIDAANGVINNFIRDYVNATAKSVNSEIVTEIMEKLRTKLH